MNNRAKHMSLVSLIAVTLVGLNTECQAYEIWAGTQNFTAEMISNPSGWALTARKMKGANINWGAVALPPEDRAAVFDKFLTADKHAYQVQNHPMGPITTADEWSTGFERATAWHYTLNYIYIYSSGGEQNWTEPEVQIMRNWLDNNGHADCKIAFNGRNIGDTEEFGWPLIEGNGIENDPSRWLAVNDTRAALLKWIADPSNAAATGGERAVLHTKLRGLNDQEDITVWTDIRKFTRYINRDVLGNRLAFVQSNKLIFTFFGKTGALEFMPETTSATQYARTTTGLWLSLQEQTAKFSGLSGAFPTDAECNSTAR